MEASTPFAVQVLLVVGGAAILFCVAAMVWLKWSLRCNDKTYAQRIEILDRMHKSNDYRRMGVLFDTVSYDDHMRALEWRRDPLKLYPSAIQQLMSQEIA